MRSWTLVAGSVALTLGYFVLPIIDLAETNPQIVLLYGLQNRDLIIFSLISLSLIVIVSRLIMIKEILSKVLLSILLSMSVLYLCSFLLNGFRYLSLPLLVSTFFLIKYRFSFLKRLTSFMLIPFILIAIIKYLPKFLTRPDHQMNTSNLVLRSDAPKNVIILMLDGSDITSFGLGSDLYPRRDLFPVLNRLLVKDFEWFPNTYSNGSYTDISLKLMFTGISDLKQAYKIYKNLNPLFSALSRHYNPSIFQFKNYYQNFCDERPDGCYPFTGETIVPKFKGLSVLFELYFHRLSLYNSVLSFRTGLDFNPEDLTFLSLKQVTGHVKEIANETRNFLYFHGFNRTYEQQFSFEHQLNGFMKLLKEKGWYDDSLILIISDHGVDFTQDGYKYGPLTKHNDITFKVPLAIKWPKSKKKGLRKELAQNLDLFPTIMHSVFESKQLEKFKMDGNDLNGPLPHWREIKMYCSEKGEIASLNKDMTMSTCQKSKD